MTLQEVKNKVLPMVEQAKEKDRFYFWFIADYTIQVMGFTGMYHSSFKGEYWKRIIKLKDVKNKTVLTFSSCNNNEILEETYDFLANLIEQRNDKIKSLNY